MTLTLKLSDIASWGNPDDQQTAVQKVAIPALQRGLVWRPKQIELLWDSLMRGIPIGSFVICTFIKNQLRKNKNAEYHLLDGQQRANAIQLGFAPFPPKGKADSILWLDLAPKDMPKDSSRSFLFRVTTPAHPWGYTKDDSENTLRAGEIRKCLEENQIKSPENESYERPNPCEIRPKEANIPVPFSLVLSCYHENDDLFQESLRQKFKQLESHYSWAKTALNALANSEIELPILVHGINVALGSRILALQAPDELLSPSMQEINNDDQTGITNIEHLFQRLNQQGTRLDGEELIYSMIKNLSVNNYDLV